MFGQDEFRSLLKKSLKYVDATDEVDEEALIETARVLSSSCDIVMSWAKGLARPTPQEERTVVVLLRGVQNFQ